MSNPDNSAKHDINILYYNARSLFPKIDELRLEYANRRPDIVCIVESWIDNSVTDGELLCLATSCTGEITTGMGVVFLSM